MINPSKIGVYLDAHGNKKVGYLCLKGIRTWLVGEIPTPEMIEIFQSNILEKSRKKDAQNREKIEADRKNLASIEALKSELVTHTFRIREDFVAEIGLPKNLTQKEANRISEYLKILPFSSN